MRRSSPMTRTRTDELRWIAPTLAALLLSGCSGSQQRAAEPPASGSEAAPPTPETDEVVEETEPVGSEEPGPVENGLAACRSYRGRDEADPLRRWIGAFPIHLGGAVLIFTGPQVEQMEVEAVLEMSGIAGYEDHACDDALVVWVPGFECRGEAEALAREIEGSTSMTLADSHCFRIDETRMRLREECAAGRLPERHCR